MRIERYIRLQILLAGTLLFLPALHAGDLTTDNLTVKRNAEVSGFLKVGMPAAPADGLLLHYSLDADQGGVVSDDSGNSNVATVTAAVWTSDGITGGAYDFDGTNGILAGSTTNNLPTANAPKTFSAWFKADAYNAGTIVKHGSESPLMGQCIQLIFSDYGNGWGIWLNGYSTDVSGVTRSLVTGTWYHVCATYGSGIGTIYINGEFDASGAFTQYIPVNKRLTAGHNPESGWLAFDGKVDEIRVYNRVLSATEIKALYLHDVDLPTGEVDFRKGVQYLAPRGDLQMGVYTNNP